MTFQLSLMQQIEVFLVMVWFHFGIFFRTHKQLLKVGRKYFKREEAGIFCRVTCKNFINHAFWVYLMSSLISRLESTASTLSISLGCTLSPVSQLKYSNLVVHCSYVRTVMPYHLPSPPPPPPSNKTQEKAMHSWLPPSFCFNSRGESSVKNNLSLVNNSYPFFSPKCGTGNTKRNISQWLETECGRRRRKFRTSLLNSIGDEIGAESEGSGRRQVEE